MRKRKVLSAFFIHSLTAPGAFGGETTLNGEKQDGIEMYTGIEPGFLTVFFRGKEIGIPIANCRTLVWAAEEVKK